MLSGAAMCVSSISNEMVANESRDKQEPLALGSKVAAGISAKRTLGSGTASMVVSAIGFGCMGLNYHRSQHPGKKQVIALVHEAIDRGVTLFDTAESYGYQTNERLVGEALKGYSDRVFVTTKFGHKFVDGVQIKTEEDSSPNNIRKVCENSLRNLGVETLGMFYQHRADPNTPIEVVAETVNELIREGKVLHFGLCEVNADTIRREWNACGLRKGYMYMADAVTDPRWQRTYGTFGEDPALISEIMAHIIPRIQGSDHGVTEDGVAVTTKHFPGGGARENGFDPHYAAGQWNVYATPGSLETYHLPPFAAAVKAGTSSIMPYYSKPAAAKSAVQHDLAGNTVEMKPYGFAYNKYFIDTMLRGQMGFDGYINSDTGIAHNMAWGVEMLDVPERIGFAVANAGVDIISGLFDNEAGMEAYNRGKNGYYETHPLPEGFAKEELTLTDEALDRAVARTLTELFALGMFENPYRDPDEAARIVATPSDWEAAADAHRRSVVLLKNDGTLPLTADKRANKKIYAEAFLKNAKHAADSTAALRKELADTCTLVDDPAQADFALLFVSPSSGEYFNATPGYLELDICEDKTVCNVDANGKPMADTHTETTLHGGKRLAEIAASVHANGGKVITNVNITLAWQLGNVEPLCDVLLAGFDTYRSATLDVIFGCFAPTGKLPLTLPRGDAVLAVNADGVCISPNDVPGYDKDRYMPDSLKDENGKAYAYRDAAGNYYEYGFGLEG